MKRISTYYYSLFIIMGLSCHKATTTTNYTGRIIFPTQLNAFSSNAGTWLNTDNFSGAVLKNGILTFPLQSNDNLIPGFLSYEIQSKKTSYSNIPAQNDTNTINALYNLQTGKYLGVCSNQLQRIVFGGINYFPFKLTLFNENLNTLKQIVISDSVSSYSNIYPDGKGYYYICVRSPLRLNLLYCFDENLNIKWEQELTSTPWAAPQLPGLWDVCFVGNSSFHLVNFSITGIEFGHIIKLDVDGNFVINSPVFKYELSPAKIIKDATGFRVYGSYARADKRHILYLSRYDTDCNLLETKYFDTDIFSKYDTYTFSFNSNIIDVNGENYFVVHINNHTSQDAKTNEAKLVKINKALELEWAKTIDEFRIADDRGLLKNDGDKLICVGKSVWNGLEGFSFIQTDMNGNIIK